MREKLLKQKLNNSEIIKNLNYILEVSNTLLIKHLSNKLLSNIVKQNEIIDEFLEIDNYKDEIPEEELQFLYKNSKKIKWVFKIFTYLLKIKKLINVISDLL